MTQGIDVFTQNSIRIAAAAGKVYIDPFRMREEPHDADFILITHDHYDHFSPEDIAKVCRKDTVLIVPEKMAGKAQKEVKEPLALQTVSPGKTYEINGLSFETVASYNVLKPFHPKFAGWVGYVIRDDGRRIYIAGDTDATKESKAVKCDIALVPVGGTYTMDAKNAAELINTIRPSVAIPVHYGAVVGNAKDADRFSELVKPPTQVEILMQFG